MVQDDLSRSAGEHKTVIWIHFDWSGAVQKVIRYNGEGLTTLQRPLDHTGLIALVMGGSTYGEERPGVEADVLFFDGVSQGIYKDIFSLLRGWRDAGLEVKVPPVGRAGFITMSNTIEREHIWEIRASGDLYMYHTQHSWTPQELQEALIKPDGTRSEIFQQSKSIFEKEWEIEDDDPHSEAKRRANKKRKRSGKKKLASIQEIVSQKYYTTGGSARWMFQLTTLETEKFLNRK